MNLIKDKKMKNRITQESIAKCKRIGINADQLDELVDGAQSDLTPIKRLKYHSQNVVFKSDADAQINHNVVADLLANAHRMIADNQEQGHLLSIPKEQLRIVSDAIKYYRENAPIDDHAHFDTYSLEQLFSGDYRVDVNLTDNNSQFGLKSGVDIPEFVDDDEPTGSCPSCAKYLYDSSEYCDDTCRDNC